MTSEPAGHPRRWLVLPILAMGVALIIVDSTIVNVALPEVVDELGLDLADAEWVNSAYSLTFAALLVAVGSVADRSGRRRMFVIGLLVFALASLWAGLATSGGMLIAARFAQGVGGALILPTTLSIVNATFRGRERAIAFGVWGSVIGGTAALGPVLGGWLTTNVDWRAIFLINPPVAVALVVLALLIVPESRDAAATGLRDPVGVVLVSLGLAALVFGLIEGQRYGWWSADEPFSVAGAEWPLPGSPVPWALAASAVLLGGFVLWLEVRSRRRRPCLIDLGLFRLPSFRWGGLTILIVSLGEFGLIFVIPLYLQNVLGLTALETGLVIVALAGGAFLSGGAAAPLSRRLGGRQIVRLGMALEVAGIAAFALTVGVDVSAWRYVPSLFVYGIGIGFATAQLTNVTLSQVPTVQSGQASGVQGTLRQVGSALGTAILGVALSLAATHHATTALEARGVPPAQAEQVADTVSSSAGTALPALARDPRTAPLSADLDQAFTDAVRTVGLVAGAFVLLGLLAAGLIPRDPRPGRAPPAAAAAAEGPQA